MPAWLDAFDSAASRAPPLSLPLPTPPLLLAPPLGLPIPLSSNRYTLNVIIKTIEQSSNQNNPGFN